MPESPADRRIPKPEHDFAARHAMPSELTKTDDISETGAGPVSDLLRRIKGCSNEAERALLVFQWDSLRFASGFASSLPTAPTVTLQVPGAAPAISVENREPTEAPSAALVPGSSANAWDNIDLHTIISSQIAEQSFDRIVSLPAPKQRTPNQEELRASFASQKYFIAEPNLNTVACSIATGKPIIVEGPPGTGKTTLAEQLAVACGLDPKNPNHLIEIFCTPDIRKDAILYDWNDSRRLMDMQFLQGVAPFIPPTLWKKLYQDLAKEAYSLRYLNVHRLLKAVLLPYRSVVLIDEIDKTFPEFDNLLLDILERQSFVIPEIGRLGGAKTTEQCPIFVITSNAQRELSSPLKRRANYVFFNFLNEVTETEVLMVKSGLTQAQAQLVAKFFREMREHKQFRPSHLPSTAEALYTARTLRESKQPITRASLFRYHGLWLKGREDFDMFYRLFGDEIRAANAAAA